MTFKDDGEGSKWNICNPEKKDENMSYMTGIFNNFYRSINRSLAQAQGDSL
jgi:hypothetical protein